MKKLIALSVAVLGTVFALSLAASPAQAQASRTWVSGVGDDANPCSRTAPCKTFAGAISKTATAGEINCLDSGGFGAVTVTKSITILCEGVVGGILAAQGVGHVLEWTHNDYSTPLTLTAFAYLLALLVIHLLVPCLQPAKIDSPH